MNYSAFALLVIALAIATAFAPASSYAQSPGESELTAEELTIFHAINAERTVAGLSHLAVHPLLNQAAQSHADDILHNKNFSHYGSDGSLARNRVARTGYSDRPWVSENWVTSTSPEAAMHWWMNDYIHQVNILTPRWQEVGIGAAINGETDRMVFVTVFSAGQGAEGAVVSQTDARSSTAASASLSVPADGFSYTVRAGDTLLGIAIRYDLDYTVIASVNGLSEDSLLQIGQAIYISGDGASASAYSPGIGGPSDIVTVDYAIEAGDTLVSIAAQNGLEWQHLARMNGLSEYSLLQINQLLRVPAQDEESESISTEVAEVATSIDSVQSATGVDSPSDGPVLHIVVMGDTLLGIAIAYGVSVDNLYGLNGMSEFSLLQPDQVIRLR